VVLSALYMARAIYLVFYGELKPENRGVQEAPGIMSLPLLVLAILSVFAGFIIFPLGGGYEGIGNFLFTAEHHAHDLTIEALWTIVSIVLAVGGMALGIWLFKSQRASVDALRARFAPLHRLLINRYYMDALYQWIVDNVVLAAGRLVAFFDRRFVNDGGVNGVGYATVEAGKRLRVHVTGLFADYGIAMTGGVSLIVLYLWWRSS